MGSEATDNVSDGWPARAPSPPGRRMAKGALPDDERSSLITPFTVVPRLLARSTAGQVLWNVLLFVALPATLFSYWILTNATAALPSEYQQLRVALPLAAVWVVMSPVLMYIGERAAARWVASLAADADFGWNVERVRRWKRRIDLLYYPIALLGAAAAVTALVFALPAVRNVIPAPAGWGTAVQLFVFGQAGFTAIGGLHGVIRWIVVTRAAVSGTTLRWHPFRAPRHHSLARSYQLSLLLGVFFSSGAFFVPALLAVVGQLEPIARTVVWGFIILLLIGGILIFVVPMATLLAALAGGKRQYVSKVESVLGDLLDEMVQRRNSDDREAFEHADAIERLMTIHAGLAATRLIPMGQTLARALLTVVIPVASLALSVVQSGVLTV